MGISGLPWNAGVNEDSKVKSILALRKDWVEEVKSGKCADGSELVKIVDLGKEADTSIGVFAFVRATNTIEKSHSNTANLNFKREGGKDCCHGCSAFYKENVSVIATAIADPADKDSFVETSIASKDNVIVSVDYFPDECGKKCSKHIKLELLLDLKIKSTIVLGAVKVVRSRKAIQSQSTCGVATSKELEDFAGTDAKDATLRKGLGFELEREVTTSDYQEDVKCDITNKVSFKIDTKSAVANGTGGVLNLKWTVDKGDLDDANKDEKLHHDLPKK